MDDNKMKIKIPVSVGELYDKIGILIIKMNKIAGDGLIDIINEYNSLMEVFDKNFQIKGKADDESWQEFQELKAINEKLWVVEDKLRVLESKNLFDDTFIYLARQVYHLNDERARIKKRINERHGSDIKEVKSYEKYD